MTPWAYDGHRDRTAGYGRGLARELVRAFEAITGTTCGRADDCVRTAAVELLRDVLADVAATDPSATGHTGPDTADSYRAYRRRDRLVWRALDLALVAGIPAGTGVDPHDQAHPLVVYLNLPTGQVSWHVSTDRRRTGRPWFLSRWDGHTTVGKYDRIARWGAIWPAG